MRLVQRNGRIDRLGSPFAGQEIYLYNLFPEGELEAMLNLYDRLLRKIAHANICVGMEAPVFEEQPRSSATSPTCASRSRASRLRTRRSSSKRRRGWMPSRARSFGWSCAPHSPASGWPNCERCRTEPAAASVASGFPRTPRASSSQSVCSSGRASSPPATTSGRGVTLTSASLDEAALADELEILRRIRCDPASPVASQRNRTGDLRLWERVQGEILAEYAERLDPAQAGIRIPASQDWAIELLAASDALLAGRDVPAADAREAAKALSSRGARS